jgi:hypothetical protein
VSRRSNAVHSNTSTNSPGCPTHVRFRSSPVWKTIGLGKTGNSRCAGCATPSILRRGLSFNQIHNGRVGMIDLRKDGGAWRSQIGHRGAWGSAVAYHRNPAADFHSRVGQRETHPVEAHCNLYQLQKRKKKEKTRD